MTITRELMKTGYGIMLFHDFLPDSYYFMNPSKRQAKVSYCLQIQTAELYRWQKYWQMKRYIKCSCDSPRWDIIEMWHSSLQKTCKLTSITTHMQNSWQALDCWPVSASGPELDVQSSDAKLLAPLGNILGSQHSSVWRRLISVSLHLHATSHTADCFPVDQGWPHTISKIKWFNMYAKCQSKQDHVHSPTMCRPSYWALRTMPVSFNWLLTCQRGQSHARRCRWRMRRCGKHRKHSRLRRPGDPGW